MKVHYSSSLWGKDKGLLGVPQKINWEFEYARGKRCIPIIYHFPKGIVFDIITFLDEAKLHEFFQKYESIEERLTPLQRRCAEQEHPYQGLSIKEIWINGEQVEGGYSSSSAISIPWEEQNAELISMRKAYSSVLKGVTCFACERFCVPYPETGSMIQKLKRFFRLERVSTLKLTTHTVEKFFPLDISFEVSDAKTQKEVCFQHPITGTNHTLYFQGTEAVEIPLGEGGNQSFYATQAIYEIDPELPYGDRLQFNSSMQYTEPKPTGDRFAPTAAASIGIIGGADGPISVFLTTINNREGMPKGKHGLPLHSCCSVPGFYKDDTSRFVLEGINIKELDSQEYKFG